jgi:hypothetical protein
MSDTLIALDAKLAAAGLSGRFFAADGIAGDAVVIDRADTRDELSLEEAIDKAKATTPVQASSEPTPAPDTPKPAAAQPGPAHESILGESRKATAADERPVIKANDRDLAEITAESWKELAKANARAPRLFRRGSEIVRLLTLDKTVGLEHVQVSELRYELVQNAAFVTVPKKGGEIPKTPPLDLVQNMLATPMPPLPFLNRLVDGAAFDASGRLVTAPGYDQASGFYVVHPLRVVRFEGTATEAAAWILQEVFSDFPFASKSDRANAFALMLTAAMREMINGNTPLFLVVSPIFGSGKGLLTVSALIPAFGADGIAVLSLGRDDDETRKRLTSTFLDGKPSLIFDNANTIDSPSLATALTTPWWTDRRLGLSENVAIPVKSIFAATAINPVLSGEIARRSVQIREQPEDAQPWQRSGFRHPDLREWVIDHRPEILGALEKIFTSWIAAERPTWSGRPLGSFEEWSRIVGGVLEHVGVHGFMENHDQLFEADDEASAWTAFINLWTDRYAESAQKTSELYHLAQEIDAFPFTGSNETAQKIAFGKALGKMRDRVFDGKTILRIESKKHGSQYQLRLGVGKVGKVGKVSHPLAYEDFSISIVARGAEPSLSSPPSPPPDIFTSFDSSLPSIPEPTSCPPIILQESSPLPESTEKPMPTSFDPIKDTADAALRQEVKDYLEVDAFNCFNDDTQALALEVARGHVDPHELLYVLEYLRQHRQRQAN